MQFPNFILIKLTQSFLPSFVMCGFNYHPAYLSGQRAKLKNVIYLEEGNGNSLQFSCLDNSIDRGAQWAIVNAVAESGHDWETKTTRTISFRTMSKAGKCNLTQLSLERGATRNCAYIFYQFVKDITLPTKVQIVKLLFSQQSCTDVRIKT